MAPVAGRWPPEKRSAALLAWGLWGVAVALTAGAFVAIALTSLTTSYATLWGDMLLWGGLLAFPTVGALIASRHPENRIGWLLCAVGIPLAAKGLSNEYAVYAILARKESLPGATLAAWGDAWVWIVAQLLLVVYLPLWFPTGQVIGPRWRVVERLAAVGIAVTVAGFMLKPGSLGNGGEYTGVNNPLGLSRPPHIADLLTYLGLALVTGCALAAIISVGVRLRQSRGVERQQIKWVVYWLGIFMVAFVANALAHVFWPAIIPVTLGVMIVTIAAIPVVIGVSILRYRLYDIDRLINHTVVYGALTALLGLLYAGGVVVFNAALDPLTRGSDLAVAGTTLIVAALARPARNRVQHVVDRRFYRRRYDATRAIDGFSARLRDELDLDSLSEELRLVVQETMQPASVCLWLRTAEPGTPQRLPS